MQTLHETELSYTQDHKLDLNGMARVLLEDLVNTVMVEQVEELGCVRNGYRERKLVTSVGTLTLKIPKLRERCHAFNGKPAIEKNFEVPSLRYNITAHVHDFLLG